MSTPNAVVSARTVPVLWKVLLWVLGVLLVLVVIFSAGIKLYLAPFIKHKLERAVKDASNGLYTLRIDELQVRFWRGQVTAGGIVLAQDSAYYKWLLNKGRDVGHSRLVFKAPVITLNHVRWREYLSEDVIRVGGIFVDYPELHLHQNALLPRRIKPLAQRATPADSLRAPVFDQLPELIGRLAQALIIDTLAIHRGTLRHQLITKDGTAYHAADSISIAFRDIRIDSSARAHTWHRVLYAADVQFGLRNYQFKAADGIYGLTIRRIQSPDPYSLVIDSLDLRTLVTDEEFVRRKQYARDRFAVFVPQVSCRELDLERFFRNDYVANAVYLDGPILNVYRDKHPPLDPTPRKMPHEIVQELSFYFKVDTLHLKNGEITYSELENGASQPGAITLTQTTIRLLNLTNDPAYMTAQAPAIVQGNTQLMGKGSLEVTLIMNLLHPQFDCRYNGTLTKMQASLFNRFFTPNENMRIEDGLVEKVVFAVQVNNGWARGHLKALYRNLKLAILHKEKKKKRKLLSFLSNLIIKSNNRNTDKKDPKIGEISYQRLNDDGFVRFLWRGLKTGLITTLTPEALANLDLDKKEKNQAKNK